MPCLAIRLKAAVHAREMLLLSLSPCVQKGPVVIDKYEDQVASQGQFKPLDGANTRLSLFAIRRSMFSYFLVEINLQ
jgi:hypothetical protein